MARWVASLSAIAAWATPWYLGARLLASSSWSVSHSMTSWFSAWTMTMAPWRRAVDNTSRIWRSSSLKCRNTTERNA